MNGYSLNFAKMENLPDRSVEDLNFNNTEIAFRTKSDEDLIKSIRLFKLMNNKFLSEKGSSLIVLGMKLGLPVNGLLKKSIFKQFCGGETIEECESTVADISKGSVFAILDYSVEAAQEEAAFVSNTAEIIRNIQHASNDERIPFTVFKLSGLARFALLEKISAKKELTSAEQTEYFRVKGRVNNICKTAFDLDVPVMIDAEESWIQEAVDNLIIETMRLYNLEKAIVYNTYQFYRTDTLALLKDHFTQAETYGFILGAKLVRGAYMEKERNRAVAFNYKSPIFVTKEETDKAYNEALMFCISHIKYLAFIAGTHNQESCSLLVELMRNERIPRNHPHVYFSQLLGMSDNLSFNLANAGFNVAKYVPYGPIKSVLPYLFRRAKENSAISGQAGKELRLLLEEKKRRSL